MRTHLQRLFFVILVAIFACTNSPKSGSAGVQAVEESKVMEGYFLIEGEVGYFVDCESKTLSRLVDNDKLKDLALEYKRLNAEETWLYGMTEGEIKEVENLLHLEMSKYSDLSKTKFCEGDIMFFTPDNRFLGVSAGTTILQLGERHGPIVFTKPKPGGGNYSNQYEMHTQKKTELATFFFDDERRIQNYEVRDPDIYLLNGVHTGMTLNEVVKIIPDLALMENISRHGMSVLKSKEMDLEFIFTDDFDKSNKSIDDLDTNSRLYLIRY